MTAMLVAPPPIPVDDLRQQAADLRQQLEALDAASATTSAASNEAIANRAVISDKQAANAAALLAIAATLTEARRAAVAGADRKAELARLNAERRALEDEREELGEQLTLADAAVRDAGGAAGQASQSASLVRLTLEATEGAVAAGESDAELDALLGPLFDAIARRDELDKKATAAAQAIRDYNRSVHGRAPGIGPRFAEPVTLNLARLPAMGKAHRSVLF